MSFTYYNVAHAVDPSQEFWFQNTGSVAEQVDLCNYETTLDVIRGALPSDGPIIEAGCGIARWVIHLRQAGFPVIGLDVSHTALVRSREAGRDLPLFVSDVMRLPFRDDSIAAAMSFGVIEHFIDGPQAALRELWRVLRPGGVALVAVPFNNYFRRVLINHLRRLRDRQKRRAGLPLRFAEYRFSAAELCRFLEQTGFDITSVHADDFRLPLGKGLWVDSSSFFGYRTGPFEIAPGHHAWEMNRRGQLARRVFDALSPWWTAGGVLAVAHARK